MADRIPKEFVPLYVRAMHDPKIVEAGPWGELLYYRAMQWCKDHPETDGVVPTWALGEIGRGIRGAHRKMHEACSSDLFVTVQDGWFISAWKTWNSTSDEIREKRTLAAHYSNHKQGYHEDRPHPDCPKCNKGNRKCVARATTHATAPATAFATLEVEMGTKYPSTPLPPARGFAPRGGGKATTRSTPQQDPDDWNGDRYRPRDYQLDPRAAHEGGWDEGLWVHPSQWRDGWAADGTRPAEAQAGEAA